MFQLLDRVPNIEPMLADLESYIVSEGLMVMKANSETITTVIAFLKILTFYLEFWAIYKWIFQDPEKYVEQLLELFNRFTKLVDDAFNSDPRFMTSRDKAFKTIVNDITIFQLDLLPTSVANQKTYCLTLFNYICFDYNMRNKYLNYNI